MWRFGSGAGEAGCPPAAGTTVGERTCGFRLNRGRPGSARYWRPRPAHHRLERLLELLLEIGLDRIDLRQPQVLQIEPEVIEPGGPWQACFQNRLGM
jgi:hypothetical protein